MAVEGEKRSVHWVFFYFVGKIIGAEAVVEAFLPGEWGSNGFRYVRKLSDVPNFE